MKKWRWTEESKEKRRGNKNPMWKGDNVKYFGIHYWIRTHKPKPKYCEECKKNKPLEVANISGKYTRNINDYKWLCRKCHLKSDNRIYRNLKQFRVKKRVFPNGICPNCNLKKEYFAKGLCKRCYRQEYDKQYYLKHKR